MQLIIEGRFADNSWTEYEPDTGTAPAPLSVVPAAWLSRHAATLTDANSPLGVLLDAASPVMPENDQLATLDLIVIAFAASQDGRGFSHAARLRSRGYAGELRARGPLLADQYPHLRAAGFDSVEIPADLATRHTALDWRRAYRHFPLRYQHAATGLGSILERRHAPVCGAQPGRSGRRDG